MPLQLDLNKSVGEAKKDAGAKLILDLKKNSMTRADARSRVALLLDISGSTEELFRKKLMHAIATRVGGIALNLDDNGDLDVLVFNTGCKEITPGFTEQNSDTYISKYVAPKVGGGTNYAPALKALQAKYGPGDPVFAIFITDGENNDQADALKALIDLSYYGPIFVQTVGVGLNTSETFDNLQEMNDLKVGTGRGQRLIDNAGFCKIDFKNATEEQVYAALLNEYPSFLAKCKAAGYLPWTKSPIGRNPNGSGSTGSNFLSNLFG